MNVWGTEIFPNPTSHHCLGGYVCQKKYHVKENVALRALFQILILATVQYQQRNDFVFCFIIYPFPFFSIRQQETVSVVPIVSKHISFVLQKNTGRVQKIVRGCRLDGKGVVNFWRGFRVQTERCCFACCFSIIF